MPLGNILNMCWFLHDVRRVLLLDGAREESNLVFIIV